MNDPTAAIEILPFWGREPWPGLTKEVSRGVSYVSYEWLEAANYLSLNLNGATLDWKRTVLSNVFDEFRKATKYVLA